MENRLAGEFMVEKFYAYYKGTRIDAYEGRRKKLRREITTKPVSKAELFDSLIENDRYPVMPVKGRGVDGLPYFSYYRDQGPRGERLDGKGGKETLAHSLFQDVFLLLPKFKLKDNLDEVIITIDTVTVDLRKWIDEKHYYVIEVMYRLEETKPYSYYYKWNGSLAFEISVTTELSKEKIEYLSNLGIQICEFTVSDKVVSKLRVVENEISAKSKQAFNRAIEENKKMEEAELLALNVEQSIYSKYVREYYENYRYNNTEIEAIILGNVNTKEEWKDKYAIMKNFEQQENEMKRRIEQARKELGTLTSLKKSHINDIKKLEQDKNEISVEINEMENKVASYKELNKVNTALKSTLKQLEEDKDDLTTQNEKLTNDLKNEKQKTIWEKVFKKNK
ncbi:hypothetical protein [Enterococcus sp. AZ103]|uniref:hypothetical protein n=1 Tax=Enterococcus sp. AZ103 TaxID=2774628 RepID=UPI003F21889C